jgi:hypothetical protein
VLISSSFVSLGVSITSHEGLILGLLAYIGHPMSSPPIGSKFPLLTC